MPIRRTPRGDVSIVSSTMELLQRPVEERVQNWLIEAGLPRPMREYRPIPKRQWRFDLAWPVEKVALEIDGGTWSQGRHTRGLGFERDVRKLNEATANGWCVLRATTTMIDKDWPDVLRVVKLALKARGDWSG